MARPNKAFVGNGKHLVFTPSPKARDYFRQLHAQLEKELDLGVHVTMRETFDHLVRLAIAGERALGIMRSRGLGQTMLDHDAPPEKPAKGKRAKRERGPSWPWRTDEEIAAQATGASKHLQIRNRP